jgi:hypothetical protein
VLRRSGLLLLGSLLLDLPAAAQDAFEIQVYDAETARPGEVGLEIHLNHFLEGTTSPSAQGEVPTDHLTHFTLEPHIGVLDWWELGLYLQTAIPSSGGWDSGGVKFRTKWRWPQRLGAFGLALNVEVSRVSKRYEADGWGSEARPIIDARWGRFYLSFNPILDIPLAGPDAWKPAFEPATKVSVDILPALSVGLEEYSGFGTIGDFLPSDQQTHRLFGIVDFKVGIVAVNFGVGYGFVGPEKWIIKSIITIEPPKPTQNGNN